ncbi:MAG: FAD-dependent oxidoreductase [Deltaproteobacteria bacterium]|jgi:NADPH-dependent glutamate synthase beta subunit-like oxidoreductase/glutamate synthase domain-containing protein 3/NAD-dependent dihydropyrimidine dehydrogenase PreA subunit|nr:FAD-dependent oxidoreductase [Deltaproteobacteria bacterium]
MDNQATINNKPPKSISGTFSGQRVESRVLEEQIQEAVTKGHRTIEVRAYGQHGIGGRLWSAGSEAIQVKISGHPGQRVGSMGVPNTVIEVLGPASDDVGWLNAGAEIVIHGNAGNGCANAMAQGKIFIAGNIGARGMTMTKHNPRFTPPELWVLGSAGDYFGEFMAGGIAVICGHEAQNPHNILGYRPFVGMVGGKVFFRGPHSGYSQADAKLIPIGDEDWSWLTENLKIFLKRIDRTELLKGFCDKAQWQLLVARSAQEKVSGPMRSMSSFRSGVWEKELGQGGLIGDLTHLDRTPIPLITNRFLRRFVPVWENRKYAAPCEATCPTGIPVQERWRLIREGRVDEAVDLALGYTPFPASVCGYLCPNLCMQSCTRQISAMAPVDVTQLGQASLAATLPELPPQSDKKIAIIGGGPAGISVAWQLRRKSHQVTIYEVAKTLGGKITQVIPRSRIPKKVITKEMQRIKEVIPQVNLQQPLGREDIIRLKEDFDFIVIATGAQKPRSLPIPGNERTIAALDFLKAAKKKKTKVGKNVVIIGAGNVGCDAAAEAHRMGAGKITLLDIQEPASFGKERDAAEAVGAEFMWPVFAREITPSGVKLTTGEELPADTVIVSIGDVPELDFIPETVETENGFVKIDDHYQTSDPQIFAIGDVVKPGLLTDAIGSGRVVAGTICDILEGKRPALEKRTMIDRQRVTLEYFDPRITEFADLDHCGSQCSSCGACRDCGICVSVCPRAAISRKALENDNYEYLVDENLCIGCGFCAGACPCGVWDLVENTPIE